MREYFLTTGRIGFSHWHSDDLPLANALWGDPDVSHFICATGVFTPEEIEKRLRTEIDNMERFGMQYYPIFDLASGELIGCCGLRPTADGPAAYEMGCHLRRQFWRKGLAQEAARAIIAYSRDALHAQELQAGHHPDNAASSRLIRALGFQRIEDRFYPNTGIYHPHYRLALR